MKKGKGDADPPRSEPFNNPFRKLGSLKSQLVPGVALEPSQKHRPVVTRAVVRIERKGHAGKEVTLVEQLDLSRNELVEWLRELKTSLGCGGTIVDNSLQLQGDQRDRVRNWLAMRGVQRIRQ